MPAPKVPNTELDREFAVSQRLDRLQLREPDLNFLVGWLSSRAPEEVDRALLGLKNDLNRELVVSQRLEPREADLNFLAGWLSISVPTKVEQALNDLERFREIRAPFRGKGSAE